MSTILLHSCCAPCLTSVYEQLSKEYQVVVFWYNPNIWPKTEHDKRYDELIRYGQEIGIEVIQGSYDYDEEHQYFLNEVKGLEKEPEKGKRCSKCYEMRLSATAWTAHEMNHHHPRFDFFASELSVSPHKDAQALNELGKQIEKEISSCNCHCEESCDDSKPQSPLGGRQSHSSTRHPELDSGSIIVKYLPSNFKKADGFKRSTELSKEHNLYRQNYCGCEFSKK